MGVAGEEVRMPVVVEVASRFCRRSVVVTITVLVGTLTWLAHQATAGWKLSTQSAIMLYCGLQPAAATAAAWTEPRRMREWSILATLCVQRRSVEVIVVTVMIAIKAIVMSRQVVQPALLLYQNTSRQAAENISIIAEFFALRQWSGFNRALKVPRPWTLVISACGNSLDSNSRPVATESSGGIFSGPSDGSL